MTSDPMIEARTQAICEINGAMLKAAGDALARHGNDPHSAPILLAAVALFVKSIDKNIEPGFQRKVVAMLDPVGGAS
jgi:hypothetical protein